MSKVKLYTLFSEFGVDYNPINIKRYNNGWGFSEIKRGEEYIEKGFNEDKRIFLHKF